MGKYVAINEAPIYVLEGAEDVLEEELDATDDVLIDNADEAMVSALPCFNIILFSLEINFIMSSIYLFHV